MLCRLKETLIRDESYSSAKRNSFEIRKFNAISVLHQARYRVFVGFHGCSCLAEGVLSLRSYAATCRIDLHLVLVSRLAQFVRVLGFSNDR